MKRLFTTLGLLVALISVSLFSCKNNAVDQATSDDVKVADLAVNEVFTYTSSETGTSKLAMDEDNGMDVDIDIDSASGKGITLISFQNYQTRNGHTLNGQIKIEWQLGWFTDSTKSASVTFINYKRDSIGIEGYITIRHSFTITENLEFHPVYKITESNMKITLPDGKNATWSGTKEIEWLSGWKTRFLRSDDIYKINWQKNGTNRNGVGFTATGTDIKYDATCTKFPLTEGKISIVTDEGKSLEINYGDGECDGSYTVTVGNSTIVVDND